MTTYRIVRIGLLGLFLVSLALPLTGCKGGNSDDARYDKDAKGRSMENQGGNYTGAGSSKGR